MTNLPVYSPTETEDYLVCPRFRVLKRRFQPRGTEWQPHMALGNAIHEGLAAKYGPQSGDPLEDAFQVMRKEFVEGSEWTLEGLLKLTEKGLKVALETELVSPEGKVVGVERWVGHSRLDLVSREPFGLVVTDHKVSLKLEKARGLDYKIRDHDPSWQLLHQAWAVRQEFGECPTWARAHIIAISPRPFTHVHSVGPLDDQRLDDFEKSAAYHWEAMRMDDVHAGRGEGGYALGPEHCLPPMNTKSCWQYGRKCEFYEGCHVYGGDLTKFPALYEESE